MVLEVCLEEGKVRLRTLCGGSVSLCGPGGGAYAWYTGWGPGAAV